MHIITGGSDAEQRRDGDYLAKDERYDRTDEYLDIVKQAWTVGRAVQLPRPVLPGRGLLLASVQLAAAAPASRSTSAARPTAAYRVGGKHADVYALWGEPLAETAEQIASVNAAAARRRPRPTPPRISVSLPADPRPDRGARLGAGAPDPGRPPRPNIEDVPEPVARARPGARRRRAGEPRARSGCWPPRPRASCTTAPCGPRWPPRPAPAGNSTALVGTPETVAQALLDYVDIGVTTLLIRGYDPYDDAIDYGRYLLPLVREEVARRDAEQAAPQAAGEPAAVRA